MRVSKLVTKRPHTDAVPSVDTRGGSKWHCKMACHEQRLLREESDVRIPPMLWLHRDPPQSRVNVGFLQKQLVLARKRVSKDNMRVG